ncbi:MAG: TolC family protein [Gemmatimonadaceae bacterium]|jgi:outer membrane protein|nr:TolC family protein [Gemmatimonadaceae bacterium]
MMLSRLVCAALLVAGPVLHAQAPATLTLEEAVATALRNSPTYLQTRNELRTASAQSRTAWGAFLPSVNTSSGASFREGRQQVFGGVNFGAANATIGSSIGGSADMQLSMGQLYDARAQSRTVDATESRIAQSAADLRNTVTGQFLTALQRQAQADLQDTLLANTQAQLDLAQARFRVGSGTQLDVQRAEVTHGQQRVARLRAVNQAQVERLRLFQSMGVEPMEGTRLVADLPMVMPEQSLQELLAEGRRSSPALREQDDRLAAAKLGTRSARSAYLPSMQLSASVGAFTNQFANTGQLVDQARTQTLGQQAGCIRTEEVRAALNLPNQLATCRAIAFTPAQEEQIRSGNRTWPFDFTRNPYNLSLNLSLPIFNGFQREQRVEQARVLERNAQYQRRQVELTQTTNISSAYLDLVTARDAVAIQEQNVGAARNALLLANERYRAGAITAVDLVQVRTDFERAATDRITAIYDFHRARAALDAAIGRPIATR